MIELKLWNLLNPIATIQHLIKVSPCIYLCNVWGFCFGINYPSMNFTSLFNELYYSFNSTYPSRWHHPYGRKWRGTKKPLDESERGEWKSWLKIQHSENWDNGIQSHHLGEGDGTPLQYSCLEYPVDGGAWWAAVYGVAQSRTLLKRLTAAAAAAAR